MPRQHVVQEGDGISSISEQYGFAPATVWNAAENAALRQKREDGNVLMAGDVVMIPDARVKQLERETGKRHRFRKVDVPPLFELQLLEQGSPLAQLAYTLTIDGKSQSGSTDDEGVLREFVPSTARKGSLSYTVDGEKHELNLNFGELDPITELIGVQKRLNNLGFGCGAPDGTLNAATKLALQQFQMAVGLDASGELDQATRDQLRQAHDTSSTFGADDGDGDDDGDS